MTPKKKPVPKSPRTPGEKRRDTRTFTVLDSGKKLLRKSTAAKSAATLQKLKARHEAEKNKPKTIKTDDYIPTQEELLEEATITEKENLKSLEKFRRMELEKKKVRPTKNSQFIGPIIRYHSMSMPVVEEILESDIKKEPEDNDGERMDVDTAKR